MIASALTTNRPSWNLSLYRLFWDGSDTHRISQSEHSTAMCLSATLSACSVADSELLLSLLTKPVVNNIQQIMIERYQLRSGFSFLSVWSGDRIWANSNTQSTHHWVNNYGLLSYKGDSIGRKWEDKLTRNEVSIKSTVYIIQLQCSSQREYLDVIIPQKVEVIVIWMII